MSDISLLKLSIKHWDRLLECKTYIDIHTEGFGVHECALCQVYFNGDLDTGEECTDCPIAKESKTSGCDHTPYMDFTASVVWEDQDKPVNLETKTTILKQLIYLRILLIKLMEKEYDRK